MENKHQYNAEDLALFRKINTQIKQRVQISPAKTRRLLLIKLSGYVILSVALYALLLTIDSTAMFILSYMGYGLCSLLLAFNFAHDLSHDTVFKDRKWNQFCFEFIYMLTGAHGASWKDRHVDSHHFAPNVEHYDTDLNISKLIRVIPGSKLSWYHRFQHLYAPFAYTTYSLFWVFIKDPVVLYGGKEEAKPFSYHLSFWMQKAIYLSYLLVLPLLYSGHSWGVVLLAFLLMHLFQSLFLLFTFFITHHVEGTVYPKVSNEGDIQISWFMNQVKSSNDFYPFSKLANFIFGGFNNHVAHHLFPSINHVHYPEVSRVIYEILEEENITPNHTSYLGGIKSHLSLLRRMGTVIV
jgi:linoleoyl-CoA desaturase